MEEIMMRFIYNKSQFLGCAASLSLCSLGQAIATPIFFSASDPSSGFVSPITNMPNSIAAFTSWDSH